MKKAQEALTGIWSDTTLDKRAGLLGYDSVADYLEAARLGSESCYARQRGDKEAASELRRLRHEIQQRNPRVIARKASLRAKAKRKG
jgi:hypothetical protein